MTGQETYVDAGKLREPVRVLELRETGPGCWTWEPVRRTWARVELRPGVNLFSRVGIGARNAELVLRRQRLSLHNDLSWRGQHLFLTAVSARGRGHLDVSAALAAPIAVRVLARRQAEPDAAPEGTVFPAVLTEKYLGHAQGEPLAELELRMVLVTPKTIRLTAGGLVEAAGQVWAVRVPHELEPCQNEYEIVRGVDV